MKFFHHMFLILFFFVQHSLSSMNQPLVSHEDPSIFYATVNDKRWASMRLFFIGKHDKASSLHNISCNTIRHIFKFVDGKREWYIAEHTKYRDDFRRNHYSYTIKCDVLIDQHLSEKVVEIIGKKTKCYWTAVFVESYTKSVHFTHIYDVPQKFQEYVDILNKTLKN